MLKEVWDRRTILVGNEELSHTKRCRAVKIAKLKVNIKQLFLFCIIGSKKIASLTKRVGMNFGA